MDAREASDLIEEALQKVVQSNEDYEDGDQILDWVVIAYAANPDKEKGNSYPMFMANGLMPTYRVRGLLDTAKLIVGGD